MNRKVLKQYEAVRKGIGWRKLSGRGKVRVTGPDHVTFLHSMISNEVEGLGEGEGNYGTFLTATGKILADFYYYRFSEYVLIDIAAALLERFVETLSSYIIMDDVQLEDVSTELSHYAVEGPKSMDLLESILGDGVPADRYSVSTSVWKGGGLWWLRKDELSDTGFEIILPKYSSQELETALAEEGLAYGIEETGPEAFELLRMERGIPIYGIDFSEKNNPVEARLVEAYSLKKGCYLGQEVVSKATLVGSAPKALSRLKIEGQVVPERGAAVIGPGGKEVGFITSAIFSPLFGQPIALAFLRKGFWNPGEIHRVECQSAGPLRAEVVERFQ